MFLKGILHRQGEIIQKSLTLDNGKFVDFIQMLDYCQVILTIWCWVYAFLIKY